MRTRYKLLFALIVIVVAVVTVTSLVTIFAGVSEEDGGMRVTKTRQMNSVAPAGSGFVGQPEMEFAAQDAPAPMAQKTEDATPATRLIVRSGNLSIVTADVRKSVDDLTKIATSVGGFVVSANVEGSADEPSATVTIRVPVEKFEEVIANTKGTGVRVTDEYVAGEDVTEDYVDTQSRIKTLQASEEQFMEIMKRVQKVSDVLEVQRELERVRSQIEVAKGHAEYLEKTAKMSAITVYYAVDEGQLPVVDPVKAWSPMVIAKSAFRALVKVAQSLGTLVIWLIVFIPLWIALAVVYVILRRIRRNRANVRS